MATNVPIPNMGDSISSATILRWLKNDGDYVQVDDGLMELETDKANTELPATVAGVLHQKRKIGDVVKVGEVVALIDETATAPAAGKSEAPKAVDAPKPIEAAKPAETPKPQAQTQTPAGQAAGALGATSGDADDLNPSVRPLIVEHKLDPKSIPATGPHGRLLKEDVLRYLEGRNGKAEAAASAPAAPAVATATVAPAAPAIKPPVPSAPSVPASGKSPKPGDKPAPGDYDSNGEARVPISKIQKRTAENLKQAQNTAAILTTFNEIDMSAIMELRSRLKERFEKTHGVGLGFMSFFARAVVLGLREFPKINAFIRGDDIVYHEHVNLGIAVSTDKGLAVPVLRNAEKMSFAKIESEIKRLATAVREGKLTLTELTGGTFSITNGGVFGSLMSTPIINPPQSGILGMHAILKRPVAVNDQVVIRPMMYVALSYDHRMVNGKDSVSFLVRVKEYLEDPARLMLEV